jgi:protein-S-isoprenylcysteine O-methyltransferase Ste14
MLALRGGGVVQVSGQVAAARREAAPREMMRAFHQYSVTALWLVWLVYWIIAAIGAKPTRRREGIASRLSHVVPLVLGIVLLSLPHAPAAWLGLRYLPQTEGWFWLGFCLVAFGIAFSVAARLSLGGNWSGTVTLKQDHELIRSGPYHWVRHPIYTGLLLAVLGSAITQGECRSLIAVALIAGALLRKIAIEERFLAVQFGAAYARYRDEVPALVPMPWRGG